MLVAPKAGVFRQSDREDLLRACGGQPDLRGAVAIDTPYGFVGWAVRAGAPGRVSSSMLLRVASRVRLAERLPAWDGRGRLLYPGTLTDDTLDYSFSHSAPEAVCAGGPFALVDYNDDTNPVPPSAWAALAATLHGLGHYVEGVSDVARAGCCGAACPLCGDALGAAPPPARDSSGRPCPLCHPGQVEPQAPWRPAVAEWRASERDVLARFAASAIGGFPPGLCPLIASFVPTERATAAALWRRYRADPATGVSVVAQACGLRATLTVAARNDARLTPACSLEVAGRPSSLWAAAATARLDAVPHAARAVCLAAALLAEAGPGDARATLRALLPPARLADWATTQDGACQARWRDPQGSIDLLAAQRRLPLRADAAPAKPRAAAAPAGENAWAPELDRAISYAALWANAFPASCYPPADDDAPAPAPAPLTTAEVLAASKQLDDALPPLLAAAERPGRDLLLLEPAAAAMRRWPVRPNSLYGLCRRLWFLHADSNRESWDAGEVPVAALSACAARWHGDRETAQTALYAAYLQALAAAARAGVELVGLGRAELTDFLRRAAPEAPPASDPLLDALIGDLNFAWRRSGAPRRAELVVDGDA